MGNNFASMNDYWNDPPEEYEPPECCGEFMEIDENGVCVCVSCERKIEPFPDIEPCLDIELPE